MAVSPDLFELFRVAAFPRLTKLYLCSTAEYAGRLRMRKSGNYYVYPAYFEADRTRESGRRVAKKLALPSVDPSMISQAARRLRLEHTVRPEARYPGNWWGTPGLVLVKKTNEWSKMRLLRELAKAMASLKGTSHQ
jgi:signal recognition particle subunit SRP19